MLPRIASPMLQKIENGGIRKIRRIPNLGFVQVKNDHHDREPLTLLIAKLRKRLHREHKPMSRDREHRGEENS
ncbi:hypothetical protein H5410_004170 [Solanum commersonii]|uniref:Uncharacterized protein n=1 Tax=Solanum commersonii TaxID=4109 RepID=A0A9J6B6M9_SOLCO|nr:hypothetical protein H5410_004170 [Solanum commersonii]